MLETQEFKIWPSGPSGPTGSLDLLLDRHCGTLHGEQMDSIAIEEPLEIRLQEKGLSITMRTPGEDKFLAAGFLFTEGIIRHPDQIQEILPCGKINQLGDHKFHNIIKVKLRPGVKIEMKGLERNFYTTSSCGLCGKASLEALLMDDCAPIADHEGPNTNTNTKIKASILMKLPGILQDHQHLFKKTGGLHASALFDEKGHLWQLCEDVGRHNALDKLIGHQFLQGNLPLRDKILLLSGRVSFELMQKALRAGISVVAAVGAPSSLAVDAAKRFNMTLVGFIRENRFNIYHGKQRIVSDETKDF